MLLLIYNMISWKLFPQKALYCYMNPIKKTLLTLLGYVVLIVLINIILGARGDFNFICIVYSLYLMPVVGVLFYALFLLLSKKGWMQENRSQMIAFGLFLLFWLLCVIVYIWSLFE